jgi:hypothetical protein
VVSTRTKYLHPSELTEQHLLALNVKFGILPAGSKLTKGCEQVRDWYSYWYRHANRTSPTALEWMDKCDEAMALARLRGHHG